MANYALVKNNIVQTILQTNNPSQDYPDIFQYLVSCNASVGDNWNYDGKNFTPPGPPPPTQQQIYENLITEAMAFGNQLIVQFAAENIILGITQAGLVGPLLAYTSTLINCLITGSLNAAIDQINLMIADTSATKVALDPFITNDRLNLYKTQIQNWLQAPY